VSSIFLKGFNMTTLGNRLRELRKEKGLYQKDLASLLDITIRGYQVYEEDKNYPILDKIIFLADYYNVSLDYLCGRSDKRERE